MRRTLKGLGLPVYEPEVVVFAIHWGSGNVVFIVWIWIWTVMYCNGF